MTGVLEIATAIRLRKEIQAAVWFQSYLARSSPASRWWGEVLPWPTWPASNAFSGLFFLMLGSLPAQGSCRTQAAELLRQNRRRDFTAEYAEDAEEEKLLLGTRSKTCSSFQ